MVRCTVIGAIGSQSPATPSRSGASAPPTAAATTGHDVRDRNARTASTPTRPWVTISIGAFRVGLGHPRGSCPQLRSPGAAATGKRRAAQWWASWPPGAPASDPAGPVAGGCKAFRYATRSINSWTVSESL
jgi:hypothetical protein